MVVVVEHTGLWIGFRESWGDQMSHYRLFNSIFFHFNIYSLTSIEK